MENPMKNRFTSSEWAQLKRMPFLMCQHVALAPGSTPGGILDADEARRMLRQQLAQADGSTGREYETEFAYFLRHYIAYEPLQIEVLADLRERGYQSAWSERERLSRQLEDLTATAERDQGVWSGAGDISEEITGICSVLKANLTREEYHRFLYVMVIFVAMVAVRVAGGGKRGGLFRRRGFPPGSREAGHQAVVTLTSTLGIREADFAEGRRAFQRLPGLPPGLAGYI